MQADICLEKKYQLRQNRRKLKRSSFIYPGVQKKSKKLYCKCQKPYDGTFMIFCELCKEWFHLECLGLEKKDIPDQETQFFCSSCSESTIPDVLKTKSVDGDDISSDSEESVISSDDSITFNEEEDLFEDLYKIMSCDSTNCSEDSHVRHHEFCANPLKYLRGQRRLFGFGYNKFSSRTIGILTKHLMTGLVVNKYVDERRPYTGGTYNVIKNLDPGKLHKVLKYYACIADKYIMFVALKETQIFLTMKHLDISYKEAETILLLAEKSRDG